MNAAPVVVAFTDSPLVSLLRVGGLWTWLLIGSAVLAAAEIILLHRARRVFLCAAGRRSRVISWNPRSVSAAWRRIARALPAASAPQRQRKHAVDHILEVMGAPATPVEPPQPTAAAGQESTLDDSDALVAAPMMSPGEAPGGAKEPAAASAADANVGIVYVDLAGRFTFATQFARDLLAWQSGELTFSDVLEGGRAECTALLDLVARQEVTDQPLRLLAGGRWQEFEIRALALRDRNGNMWGAALFLRHPGGGSSLLPGSR
jgi:hypothetical protein